jgi:hypothetical protein
MGDACPRPLRLTGKGRSDVLPTGRNLFSVDPRAVPSRMAHAQGVKLAEELLRRHIQDHGDWPTGLVVDLWGSATMRTAGEEFAMALHLAGLAPRWDADSERVSGFEILPPVLLNRPRIDVTLRSRACFAMSFRVWPNCSRPPPPLWPSATMRSPARTRTSPAPRASSDPGRASMASPWKIRQSIWARKPATRRGSMAGRLGMGARCARRHHP